MTESFTTAKSRRSAWEWIVASLVLLVAGFAIAPAFFSTIESPKANSILQSTRSINLLLFQYASDHNGAYPTGKSSTEVFQKLLDENYCNDPTLFYFEMPGKTEPTTHKLKPENVCWDVTVSVGDSDSDLVPTVFITGYRINYVPGGTARPLDIKTLKFLGLAVAYKENSTWFIKDENLPDHILKNVVNSAFDAKGKTFQQLTPTGPLAP